MKRPIIGITGNERPNPEDEFAIMSYAAKGFVEGVKEVGGTPIILPIGDADMARRYIKMYHHNSMAKKKQLTVMITIWNVICLN